MKFVLVHFVASTFHVLSVLPVFINGQLFTTFNLPKWIPQEDLKVRIDPLILTPILEAGDDELARKLSKVDSSQFLNVTSYSGYFTVNEQHNSNLFFWFFPAEGTEHLYAEDDNYDGEDEDTDYDHPFLKKLVKRPKVNDMTRSNDENKPVVLWLQGGPGSSSLFGLFTENGPFFINDDMRSIRANPWSWHKNYSVLFIDNPVGTGFSFTDDSGYCTNITQVAKHLYIGLVQFFTMFPFLKANDFFITGESFAGKYIPAIGNEIFEQNQKSYFKINLQGLALGNALSDPYNMNDYSEFAYQLGLVGLTGYREMKVMETLIKSNIDDPIAAKSYWDGALFSFLKHSNYDNLYNIQQVEAMNLSIFLDYVNQIEVRRALHVGSIPFQDPRKVYVKLIPDFLTTAIHWTEKLLNNDMRIMYYNGNWDFIVAYSLSENAFQKMKWKSAEKYRKAPRKPFVVNEKLRGYVTKADNFIEVAVLNAGHMVPTDQPEACLELIDRFFKNTL